MVGDECAHNDYENPEYGKGVIFQPYKLLADQIPRIEEAIPAHLWALPHPNPEHEDNCAPKRNDYCLQAALVQLPGVAAGLYFF